VAAHAEVDVMLTPTLAQPPRPVGWFTGGAGSPPDPAEDYRRQQAFTPFTEVYNVTRQPALSLPLGWASPTADRPVLPVGVQQCTIGGTLSVVRRRPSLIGLHAVGSMCCQPGQGRRREVSGGCRTSEDLMHQPARPQGDRPILHAAASA
jgi:hypothetical protein